MENYLEKTVMSVQQVMAYTGYSRSHLYKLISTRKIPHYKPDTAKQGKVFFCKEEINNWIFKNRVSTENEIHEQAEKIFYERAV